MNNNRPIYFIGVDEETRKRLRRELADSLNMRSIGDLARDEYRRQRDAEDPEYNWNTWGNNNDAA